MISVMSFYFDFFLINFEFFFVLISFCDLFVFLNFNEKILLVFLIRSVNFFYNKSFEYVIIDKNCVINIEIILFYKWLKMVFFDYFLGVNVDF